MSMVETIFGIVGASVSGLTIFTSGAGLIPFYVGLRTVRVLRGPRSLEVSAADVEAIHVTGYPAFALVPVLLGLGPWAFALGVLGTVVFWASLRVVVRSNGHTSRLSRRFLWIIPWRTERFEGRPDAYVDGWGDFADPSTLFVGSPAGGSPIELGFSHQGNVGRAEALAAEIVGWRPT